jgi:hypothetical protein
MTLGMWYPGCMASYCSLRNGPFGIALQVHLRGIACET